MRGTFHWKQLVFRRMISWAAKMSNFIRDKPLRKTAAEGYENDSDREFIADSSDDKDDDSQSDSELGSGRLSLFIFIDSIFLFRFIGCCGKNEYAGIQAKHTKSYKKRAGEERNWIRDYQCFLFGWNHHQEEAEDNELFQRWGSPAACWCASETSTKKKQEKEESFVFRGRGEWTEFSGLFGRCNESYAA